MRDMWFDDISGLKVFPIVMKKNFCVSLILTGYLFPAVIKVNLRLHQKMTRFAGALFF
jgi:hypothetical protein